MDLFGFKAKHKVILLESLVDTHNDLLELYHKEITRLHTLIEALETIKEEPVKEVTFSSQPLYLNEDEEDIQYAVDNELIDAASAEDMLRQLQFENAEITLDYEPY